MTNTTSRTITGIIILLLGIGLSIPAFFGFLLTLIYGIPLIILSIFLLLNKDEDKIEQIKKKKTERRKK